MTYTYQELIDRVKIYVDDNSKVSSGWKQPADWLKILLPELVSVYRKFVRQGIISLRHIDVPFIGPPIFEFLGPPDTPLPIAIIGVAQLVGSTYRVLQPASSQLGKAPFWDANVTTPATTWTCSFNQDTADTAQAAIIQGIYQLDLHPPDTAGGYFCRYVPMPTLATDLTGTVYLPPGYEDYVCLRVARKALASEGQSSQAIERLIMMAEADMTMDTFSLPMGDAPKVRVVKSFHKKMFQSNTFQVNPYYWYYF